MIDKKYCMSSYMAFRYIEDDNKEFYEGFKHNNIKPLLIIRGFLLKLWKILTVR